MTCAWTVLPAPTLPLLALAVLVPELAPWFACGCALVALAALPLARGRARSVALASAGAAFCCTLVPLVQYPDARRTADTELASFLGSRAAPPTRGVPIPFYVARDLEVRTRDGAHLGLDLYRPMPPSGTKRSIDARPTIVTIYGGAWMFGTRSQMASIDESFARLGYTVAGVDYRHAPAYRFPTQLHDVEDALAAIAAHAREWNVDANRVAILGRSAGAELALLAGYERGPLRVRAVVAYYAPTDLVNGYDEPPNPDPANVRRILVAYLGGTPAERPTAYRLASPLSAVRPGLPPTLFFCGRRDELVRISLQRTMRDALRARGDRVVAIELPWSDHAFDAVPGLGASIATPATERFLAATL